MHDNPNYLNKFVSRDIDKMKNKMAPFYFHHNPGSWFDDVLLTHKNILAGHDMHDSRAMLTGLARDVFDVSYYGGIATHAVDIREIYNTPELKPQRYIDYEREMKNLNTTLCLDFVQCHQFRTKVSMT